jgi:hypothetical protein
VAEIVTVEFFEIRTLLYHEDGGRKFSLEMLGNGLQLTVYNQQMVM